MPSLKLRKHWVGVTLPPESLTTVTAMALIICARR